MQDASLWVPGFVPLCSKHMSAITLYVLTGTTLQQGTKFQASTGCQCIAAITQ